MIGKYRDIEITIDEINNYKNNYEIIENKMVVERKCLNKQKEEFETIKNLYNLENDDIYYLNRILIDNKRKKINLITERYNEIQLYNYNVNLTLIKCLSFIVWFSIGLWFGSIIIKLI
jgi:hypothetical protein